jgi:hypothetical protein
VKYDIEGCLIHQKQRASDDTSICLRLSPSDTIPDVPNFDEEDLEALQNYLSEKMMNRSTIDQVEADDELHYEMPKSFFQRVNGVLVENAYIKSLFPELKLQKPGFDYYSYIVFIQVFMCIVLVIWFPSMDSDNTSL